MAFDMVMTSRSITFAACAAFLAGCSTTTSQPLDVNRRFDHGMTMLMQAALDGNVSATNALIAQGADVNARNDKGYTPLLLAVAEGHAEVAEVLIAHGADVNSPAGFGMNPLMLATLKRDERMTKLLKDAGAKTGFEASSDPPKHPERLPQELLRE